MTIERQNPLPVGHYWVDLPEGKVEAFQAWTYENRGDVIVNATQVTEGEHWWDNLQSSPTMTWYLFTVKRPVNYDSKTFGYPEIATPDVTSAYDVIQRPPPEPGFVDQLKGATGGLSDNIKLLTWGIAIGLGIWAYSQFKNNSQNKKT